MLKFLQTLLSPPHFDNDEKNRVAVFLHIIILTAITIALVVNLVDGLNGVYITAAAMSALILIMAVAFWANRFGKTTAASYIVVLGAVAVVTMTLAVGQGIHDIGIIDYGLILIIASFLLHRRGIIVVTLAIIISAAVVVFGEIYGLLPVQVTPDKFQPRTADFLIVALTLIVGATAIYLLSQTLENALKKSRESELRWRSLIDSIPDVVAMLDVNGTITSLNHANPGLTNFYIGKSAFDVVVSTEVKFSAMDYAAVLQGNTFTREMELITSYGTQRWFSISLGPLQQPDGKISGAIAVVRDIQEKKDAEVELRRSREALRVQARQLETLQEISRTISALADLQGTLHLILEQVQAILPMDAFVVALYDQETNMATFPLVFDDGKIYEDTPKLIYPESLIAEAIRTRKTHILNRTEEQIKNDAVTLGNRLGSKKASASVLTAPMIVHDRVIGALAVHSYAFDTYSQEHVVVLSGAANQIAIAIENARLYETSQTRAEQLATLNEIGRSISSLQDLNGVLESAYRLLKNVLNLDAFYIALYNPESKCAWFPIMVDGGKIWQEDSDVLIPDSQLAKTILGSQAYLVNRSKEEIAQRQAHPQTQYALGEQSKVSASIMMVPLQFAGKTLGAMSTQSYQLNAYTSDDLELLSGVANQVTIAIENARLYTELQKELAERNRAEAEVRNLNADLEARVRQRTAELEAANKELASFTYTVSHDLRAPIRGIHGLSHILLEEFEQKMPAEAVTQIKRIQANARQMGRLIDELLSFTHLGRQPMRKVTLDMEALTRVVIKDLMSAENRRIVFTIQPLPEAYGDLSLIRQALTNLVANAIKFTSGKESPQVEIGSLEQNGETVYFIRDNGVGFDMAYAGKLFGVFERLHRQDEFEGIGVGLAIVKRIIDKHGGRIWAEAKVNDGATLFFTMPARPPKREKRK
jgi:PAS domain S-box-containing protein